MTAGVGTFTSLIAANASSLCRQLTGMPLEHTSHEANPFARTGYLFIHFAAMLQFSSLLLKLLSATQGQILKYAVIMQPK